MRDTFCTRTNTTTSDRSLISLYRWNIRLSILVLRGVLETSFYPSNSRVIVTFRCVLSCHSVMSRQDRFPMGSRHGNIRLISLGHNHRRTVIGNLDQDRGEPGVLNLMVSQETKRHMQEQKETRIGNRTPLCLSFASSGLGLHPPKCPSI